MIIYIIIRYVLGQIHRISLRKIDSLGELQPREAKLFSRMKYGETEALNYWAERLATTLQNDPKVGELILGTRACIASSAYGEVPTPAHALTKRLQLVLEAKGIPMEMVKFERTGEFTSAEYGSMSRSAREQNCQQRKVSIVEREKTRIQGAVLVIVDDLRATGITEHTIQESLSELEPIAIIFSYLVEFSETLGTQKPELENVINRSKISTLWDLMTFYSKDNPASSRIRINSRSARFILSEGSKNEDMLRTFLASINPILLIQLYHAAISNDGYHMLPEFRKAFEILKSLYIIAHMEELQLQSREQRYAYSA